MCRFKPCDPTPIQLGHHHVHLVRRPIICPSGVGPIIVQYCFQQRHWSRASQVRTLFHPLSPSNIHLSKMLFSHSRPPIVLSNHFKHLLQLQRFLIFSSVTKLPSHETFFHFPFSLIRMTLLAMCTRVHTGISTYPLSVGPETVCQTENMAQANQQDVFDTVVLEMGNNRSGSDRLLDRFECGVRVHFRPFLFRRDPRPFLDGLPMMDFHPLTINDVSNCRAVAAPETSKSVTTHSRLPVITAT